MAGVSALDFVVDRDDLHATRLVDAEMPDASELMEGAVLVEVERFGFSANNITYASLGRTMRYWDFFPRSDGWGRVPVWGFARVAASAREGIGEGERVFGYLPMSTHVVLGRTASPRRGSWTPLRTAPSCPGSTSATRGWAGRSPPTPGARIRMPCGAHCS